MMNRVPTAARGRLTLLAFLSLVFVCSVATGQVTFKQPQPGDIYREYSRVNDTQTNDWRVTDPNTTYTPPPGGANPRDFLPNPTLPIVIDDLNGAIRAEAVIMVWGGHVGTSNKSISFNANTPIPIPELGTINGVPSGHNGQCYMAQTMVGIDIPLPHLVQGTNVFQANCGDQTCYGFGWGQFGIYGIVVRVYYNSSKPHASGSITSPAQGGTLSENPTLAVTVGSGVDRVDFLASYNGYDTDGDGVYLDYHHDYFGGKYATSVGIKNHVGTATSAPFQVVWSTQWVPDQVLGGVKILARIRGTDGTWYVPPAVENVSLQRIGRSVRFYAAQGVPEEFWVQGFAGDTKSCTITVPSSDNLGDATGGLLHLRTWNGINEFAVEPGQDQHYAKVNSWAAPNSDFGIGHYYSFDNVSMPPSALRSGSNTIEFFANTTAHHGVEILWPGPGVSVEYTGSGYASPLPNAAILASPADNSPSVSTVLTLRWRKALTATSYRLQVSTDPGFGTTAFDDANVTDTLKQVGPLSNLTKYYWRVRAQSAVGSGPYSAAWSFTTFASAPTAPVLVSPLNNATGVSVSVTLKWGAVPSAQTYRLQVGTDPGFTSGIVLEDSTITDTTRAIGGLSGGVTYYWRVSGKNSIGTGPFSSVWNFTTVITGPTAPTLLAPANNDASQPINGVVLQWHPSPGATSYRLQLGTDPTFTTGLIKNDPTIVDTFRTVNGLAANTKYYWHVNATNAGGTGPYSPTWNFSTSVPVPQQVSLILPSNGSTFSSSTMTFRWNAAQAGVTRYWFDIAIDSLFLFVTSDSSVTDTQKVIAGLQGSSRYFWRVRAGNAGGWGPYSPVWRFNLTALWVDDHPALPTAISLKQNFPNPFNPSTMVEFALPSESYVKLEVYNTLGERVAVLVDGVRPAGYHRAAFNAAGVTSGLYLCRLNVAGSGQVFVRKMLLLK